MDYKEFLVFLKMRRKVQTCFIAPSADSNQQRSWVDISNEQVNEQMNKQMNDKQNLNSSSI